VLNTLHAANAPESWQRLMKEVVAMDVTERAHALGDTLPDGLAA
jgi:hypothetical protein